jgi:hypothetical protein
MYRTIPIMCTLVVLYASVAFRPKPNGDCVKIPTSREWTGRVTLGNNPASGAGLHSTQTGITITQVADNVWKISDFTAGFFSEFGEPGQEAEVWFNCDNTVRKTTFDSPFGFVQLIGGQYEPGRKTLTLHWEIPSNGLKETSIFTIN